jgi:hypothetical protein
MITDCWIWPGTKNGSGYGVIRVKEKMDYIHRVIWAATGRDLPGRKSGLCLDHICGERACMRPAHLQLVTLGQNVLRGSAPTAVNARKKVCHRGHPLRSTKRGERTRRYCLVCLVINRDRRAAAKT